MNRIERLSAILIHLQSKKVVTASEIAERFSISLRTVYRDINALMEAGVPIGSEAGLGYFLVDGYKLSPVMFSSDEAIALIVAEKLINAFPDRFTQKNFQDALFKIKAVLKGQQKEDLARLSENLSVYFGNSIPDAKEYPFLQTIQQAIIRRNIVKIEYQSANAPESSMREIEPVFLCNYSQEWHVIAWCHLRNEYRDFRIDRMLQAEVTPKPFLKQHQLTIDDYFSNWYKQSNLYEIQIEVNAELGSIICKSKYWYGYISEQSCNNQIQLSFLNSDLNGFAKWLLYLGASVKIIKPLELKNIYINLVTSLYENLNAKQ